MAENSFEILRASREHADQLTQITIAAKSHWNYPETWMQLWIPVLTISAEYISENETWMAVTGDKPVAYYSLTSHSVIARHSVPKQSPPMGLSRNDEEVLWLDNLWVLPEYMSLGIGKNLFRHALEQARLRGFTVLKIEADPNAESFYEKMGARKIGERHHGELDGQPRILPVMEINV